MINYYLFIYLFIHLFIHSFIYVDQMDCSLMSDAFSIVVRAMLPLNTIATTGVIINIIIIIITIIIIIIIINYPGCPYICIIRNKSGLGRRVASLHQDTKEAYLCRLGAVRCDLRSEQECI